MDQSGPSRVPYGMLTVTVIWGVHTDAGGFVGNAAADAAPNEAIARTVSTAAAVRKACLAIAPAPSADQLRAVIVAMIPSQCTARRDGPACW